MSLQTANFEDVFALACQLRALDQLRLIQHLSAGLERDIIVPHKSQHPPLPSDEPVVSKTLSDLTYKAIGCAMNVHKQRGPGFREDTYQRDLGVHYAESRVPFVAQKMLDVYDSLHGRALIGYYIPDFIIGDPTNVENQAIVEIKALHGLNNSHIAQVIGYMAVYGCKVGLLINFGERSLKWRRILPPKNIQEHQVNRQWLFVPDWLKTEQG